MKFIIIIFAIAINICVLDYKVFCQKTSEEVNKSIFSFPKTSGCKLESLSTKATSTIYVNKKISALFNNMKSDLDISLKYNYNDKNQLTEVAYTDKLDPHKTLRDAMAGKILDIFNKGNKKYESVNTEIKVTDKILIKYNLKNQINQIIPPDIQMEDDDLNSVISTRIDILYDNLNRISTIRETTSGSAFNDDRYKDLHTSTFINIEYLSNFSFKATYTSQNDNSRYNKNVTDFFFDENRNLLKIKYQDQSLPGRITVDEETEYQEYYMNYTNPFSFNSNLQFILALEGSTLLGTNQTSKNFFSANLQKKITTHDLLNNEFTRTTMDNVVADKCCVTKYEINSLNPKSFKRNVADELVISKDNSTCDCYGLKDVDLARIVKPTLFTVNANEGKKTLNTVEVHKGDYVFISAIGRYIFGVHKNKEGELQQVYSTGAGISDFKLKLINNGNYKKVFPEFNFGQILFFIGDQTYSLNDMTMKNLDCKNVKGDEYFVQTKFNTEAVEYFLSPANGFLTFQANILDGNINYNLEIYKLNPLNHVNRNCFNRCPKKEPTYFGIRLGNTCYQDNLKSYWSEAFLKNDNNIEKCYHCGFTDYRGFEDNTLQSDYNHTVIGCQCVYDHEKVLVNTSDIQFIPNGEIPSFKNCLGTFDYGYSQAAGKKAGLRLHFILDIGPHLLFTKDPHGPHLDYGPTKDVY